MILVPVRAVVAETDVRPAVLVAVDPEPARTPVGVRLREVRPAAVAVAGREVDAARRRHDGSSSETSDSAAVPLHSVLGGIPQILIAEIAVLIDFVVALAASRPGPVGQRHCPPIVMLCTDADEAAVPVATPGEAVVLLGAAAVVRVPRCHFEREAVEVLAQDGVGDAGDGIRSVDGRSAVQQLVVLLHQQPRYDAQVGRPRRALHARRRQPTAVQQHQRSIRSQAAQVHRGGARSVVENEALEGQVDLPAGRRGGLLQYLAGVDEASFALHVRHDDLQRRDARVGAALDARAGDDDLLDGCVIWRDACRIGCGRRLLFVLRLVVVGFLRDDRQRDQKGQRQAQPRPSETLGKNISLCHGTSQLKSA